MPLQIDVVGNHHQRALFVFEIDAARRIGQDERANAHSPKHAGRKRDLIRGISFVKMHASLHGRHGDIANFSDHHLPGMTDRGRAREEGIFA